MVLHISGSMVQKKKKKKKSGKIVLLYVRELQVGAKSFSSSDSKCNVLFSKSASPMYCHCIMPGRYFCVLHVFFNHFQPLMLCLNVKSCFWKAGIPITAVSD